METTSDHEYDVCLSFAGEDRAYVRRVAEALAAKGVRVFFDEYREADLWGKDLYEHLADVYQNAAQYCMIFVSAAYARKVWPSHERRSAQARALRTHREYLLPARFDNTELPGLLDTVSYVWLPDKTPEEVASLLEEKIGPRTRPFYIPPVPDLLFKATKSSSSLKLQAATMSDAHGFVSGLRRMSEPERRVLMHFLLDACPEELPINLHIDADLLRRVTNQPVSALKRTLGRLGSLGFQVSVRRSEDGHGGHLTAGGSEFVLEFHNRSVEYGGRNALPTLHAMIQGVCRGYCEEHALIPLLKGDFSALSTATRREHGH